jgi:hypothetical protein
VLLGAIPLSCGIKGRAGKCPHDLRLPIAAYVTVAAKRQYVLMTEILRPSFVLLGHSTSLSANGTPAIWLMDGTNLLSTAMAGSLNPGMDWQVIA